MIRQVWRSVGRAVTGGMAVLLLGGGIRGVPISEVGPARPWDDADWTIFREKVAWGLVEGLDTVSIGVAMARLGRSLVGTPYAASTLEVPGVERLVIDFQEFDCVTFVENVFTLARFIRAPDASELLRRRAEAEARYEALLTEVRYRGGRLQGYASRLHYFSDWIADAEAKGLVRDVTRELGGVRDTEPLSFMTTHPESYRQLREDPGNVAKVRETEERLSTTGRWYLPEDKVAEAVAGIRDGDIIAATSTLPGMDVAHTGLAIWVDGTLRLMHAPTVGDSVEVSTETLAARVLRIRGQDGVMVARPCDARTPC